MSPRHRAPRAGFTAIEMLVVLGIIVLLSGMAGIAVTPALRKGRVNETANAIVEVARQARRLAMQRMAPSDNAHYGTVIAIDPDKGGAFVALIRGRPGDGKAANRERVLLDARGKPVLRYDIPPVVAVRIAALELADAPGKEVAWYAQYRTGLPLGIDRGALTNDPIEIGTRPDGAAADLPSVQLPGTADDPGLSIRTLDDRVRRAIAVYSSGIVVAEEF